MNKKILIVDNNLNNNPSPNLNNNIWNTSDDVLEQEFNDEEFEYKCRFYKIDNT